MFRGAVAAGANYYAGYPISPSTEILNIASGWAAEHPECVACIGGIYTVCDMSSRPGLEKCAPAYGVSADEQARQLKEHNPIDRLAPIAKAKVPIFHVHGDNDVVVPLERNSGELINRYRELGGPGEVEINKGCWVALEKKPPCYSNQAEYQGKCYMPVRKQDPVPQSVEP